MQTIPKEKQMHDLRYEPLTVTFEITGVPENLLKVKEILVKHNLKVEMHDE